MLENTNREPPGVVGGSSLKQRRSLLGSSVKIRHARYLLLAKSGWVHDTAHQTWVQGSLVRFLLLQDTL